MAGVLDLVCSRYAIGVNKRAEILLKPELDYAVNMNWKHKSVAESQMLWE